MAVNVISSAAGHNKSLKVAASLLDSIQRRMLSILRASSVRSALCATLCSLALRWAYQEMKLLMRCRRVLVLFLIFYGACVYADDNIHLKRDGNVISVMSGNIALYKVAVNGVHEFVDEYGVTHDSEDEAFLVGRCLIVRSDARPAEVGSLASKLDIYKTNGDKKTYNDPDITHGLYDARVFTSSDRSWSVITQEEELWVFGFYHISKDCSIKTIRFSKDFSWEGELVTGEKIFQEKYLSLIFTDSNISENINNKYEVRIESDGKYQINSK